MNRRAFLLASGAAALATPTFAQGSSPMRYSALALQTVCDAVNQDKSVEDARARMDRAINRVRGQIGSAKGFLKGFNGYDVKLVVLPEYWMTGFPLGETREEWQEKAAIPMDGAIPD